MAHPQFPFNCHTTCENCRTARKRDQFAGAENRIGCAVDAGNAIWRASLGGENHSADFSFTSRQAHPVPSLPLGGAICEGGAKTFIHKGVNGRWRKVLTAADTDRYESTANVQLGAECARWLATGER
jgi:hypothetical protein